MRTIVGISITAVAGVRAVIEIIPGTVTLGIVVEFSVIIERLLPVVAQASRTIGMIAGARPSAAIAAIAAIAATSTEATAKTTGEAATEETAAETVASTTVVFILISATAAARTRSAARVGIAVEGRIAGLGMRETRLGLRLKREARRD
jgi:hypothetical protein